MGSPDLNEITISVDYDVKGEAQWIRYVDHEGCGHESGNMDPKTSVASLVKYHLSHCKGSHQLELKPMCGFEIQAQMGEMGCPLTCKLERHGDDTKHRFEL